MADEEPTAIEDFPLEAGTSEPLLEGSLSGNDMEREEEDGMEGEGDGESDGALSCGSGLDSEFATGRTSTGRGGGEDRGELLDNLSDVSDGGWETDIDTEEEREEYDATGGAAYRNCCEMLGIIPASHLLRDLQNNSTTVSLCHHGLGAKGAKAVAAALASNTCVTSLDLSDCGLGVEGAVAITTMLRENCYITHLDLSDNKIEAAGALAVTGMLELNNTVTHLNLRGSEFGDKAADPVSEIIKTSYQITYLDISHNQFGEAAGVLLGEALGESEVLQTLNLSWNHIRRKGATALANGLKVNQMLKVFNLSHNGLGDEGAAALVEALKVNTTLTELDISGNRFTSSTATLFATKVLPVSETLAILRMGGNPMQRVISPTGDYSQLPEPAVDVAALLSAAQACPSLTSLDLSGFTFTLDMADRVVEMRETRPDLTVVYGGTGGYSRTKPLTPPLEKLVVYAAENSLVLEDLFRSFDKDQSGQLTGEEFRNSLQHIQAPLLEFERQQLIKEFGKTDPPTEEGGEQNTSIDYQALVQAAISLRGKK